MRARVKLGVAIALLASIHGMILFAGFFAPEGPITQHRDMPYAPPTPIHFIDSSGNFHLRPFFFPDVLRVDSYNQYEPARNHPCSIQFVVPGVEYKIAGLLAMRQHLLGAACDSPLYLMGSDAFGRDLFSRILYGGQISLLAGLLAAGMSLGMGTLLGAAAGFKGGIADGILMRLADLFVALPWLYLLLGLRAFLPLALDPRQALLLVIVVVGAVGWARPARLIRGIVLSARERNFVRAARGFGASDFYIVRRHILPETFSVILTQASLLVPQYVLAEITLSFLGLGVSPPTASWGNLLGDLQHYNVLENYWWMYLPAAAMVPFFLGYITLSAAVEDRARAGSM
ncbi:MAG: ABC transporter permease [Candidatus Acidiferrales bacterium]